MPHPDPVTTVAGPALRWSRALLLAAVCTTSGGLAHHLADGLMPGPAAVLALFCVCVLTAGSALGRPASTRRIMVLLLGGQTFIHGALTAMSGHRGDPRPSPLARAEVPDPSFSTGAVDGRRVGSYYDVVYAHRGAVDATELTVPAPVQHILVDMTGPHAAMAVAHLAAAAVVGLWLARGEAALWTVLLVTAGTTRRLVQCLRAAHGLLLTSLTTVRVQARGVVDALRWASGDPPRSLMLARRVLRRGPPVLLGP